MFTFSLQYLVIPYIVSLHKGASRHLVPVPNSVRYCESVVPVTTRCTAFQTGHEPRFLVYASIAERQGRSTRTLGGLWVQRKTFGKTRLETFSFSTTYASNMSMVVTTPLLGMEKYTRDRGRLSSWKRSTRAIIGMTKSIMAQIVDGQKRPASCSVQV